MVRIDIKFNPQNQAQQQNARFLSSESILQYLLGNNDKVETAILCKPEGMELITTDYNVYEALGCIESDKKVKWGRLTKFFEVVDVVSFKEKKRQGKPILTDARVEQIKKNIGAEIDSNDKNHGEDNKNS